jgi:putative methyltransferase (TIGR04325 family)
MRSTLRPGHDTWVSVVFSHVPVWFSNALGRSRLVSRVYYRRRRTVGWQNVNRYFGVFSSFDEARALIPERRRAGYDSADLASWYREKLDRPSPEDYPLLFWLKPLIESGASVFDFGGHVGVHYFGWRKHLGQATDPRWTVCDVRAVVDSGANLARERGASKNLQFVTEPGACDGFDVFLASGSLQYLEPGFLLRLLEGLRERPRHLLLNKTALHPSAAYVTVQDSGASLHPYTIASRTELLSGLSKLGYRVVDEWINPGHDCPVLLRADHAVGDYTGLYLRRD